MGFFPAWIFKKKEDDPVQNRPQSKTTNILLRQGVNFAGQF
jgi:hypothetical protein